MRVLALDPLDRVTGSCYVVHIPESNVRLLVDCGAYQDGLNADLKNEEPFPFDPSSITAVLLTHGHYDHCGRLTRLVLDGFRGHVIATEETIEIAKIVLADSARLRQRSDEAAAIDRIRWRPFGTHLFARPMSVATDVFVQALRSAHIFGAVSIEIIAGPKEDPDSQARALFSGDIGNNFDHREVQPFLRHIMHPAKTVDVAVMESTYGGTCRKPEALDPVARRKRLAEVVRDGIARGGPVIIPVFGIQRAQDLLWELHLLHAEDPTILGDAPILYDAPMGLQTHEMLLSAMRRDSVSGKGKARPVWLGRHTFRELGLDPASPTDLDIVRSVLERVFGDRPSWSAGCDVDDASVAGEALVDRMQPRWWVVPSYDRDEIIEEDRPRVVLATGGMCDGGPVQSWLRAWLEDPRATVAFPGYCGKATLGFEIAELAGMDPAERRRLHEPLSLPDSQIRRSAIAAKLHVLAGYSAHADQAGLVDWAFPTWKDGTRFPVARRVLLTHGEAGSRRALREAILNRAAAAGVDMPVLLPRPDGPGIDVRTGEPVARGLVLGTESEERAEELSLEEARRELASLRAENARLRAKVVALETKSATAPSTPGASPPSGHGAST
ncbi:MAG: Ribonuclease [Planctomycetes bacterium]|nr:Ribonuclease [Planctomycetota bacterium]